MKNSKLVQRSIFKTTVDASERLKEGQKVLDITEFTHSLLRSPLIGRSYLILLK